MIPVRIQRVFLVRHRVDFRKQINGLLAEAFLLGADPYAGDCVVFFKRDRTQLRALVGDAVGLYLVTRRFDNGCYRFALPLADDPSSASTRTITVAELSMLFEGAAFTVQMRVPPVHADAKLSS